MLIALLVLIGLGALVFHFLLALSWGAAFFGAAICVALGAASSRE